MISIKYHSHPVLSITVVSTGFCVVYQSEGKAYSLELSHAEFLNQVRFERTEKIEI